MIQKADPDKLIEYIKSVGQIRGNATVVILSSYHPFLKALETEFGKSLLESKWNRYADLLNKIVIGTATPQETIEAKVNFEDLKEWGNKINKYYETLNKISG